MHLMFETTVQDGLTYVNPLPAGHRMYALRELVSRIGRAIDRMLFVS